MPLSARPTPNSPRPAAALCLCLGAVLLVLGGCREFATHRAQLEGLHAAGDYAGAAALLDDPKVHAMYGAKNEVLWELDRGAIALANNNPDRAIEVLNRAEAQIEVTREKNAGDVLSQWALNDTAAKYIAEPYEDMYLNVIKLLAQLSAGRVEGGATVEARRAAGKATMLRDRYVKYQSALEKEGKKAPAGQPEVVEAAGTGGQFVESPLATYLTAVTFAKSGDEELSKVAARRLLDSIRIQGELIGGIKEEDFQGLEGLNNDSGNLLIVALSGRGPTKVAQRVGPIPFGTVPIYFELPELRVHPSEVGGARLEEDAGGTVQTVDHLRLVEDLSSVSVANHQQMMPLIYARTFTRYALKAAASVALTEAARRGAHDQDQGIVQLGGVLAGLALLGATEEADLRCWIFLPGQARVTFLKLPPGRHRLRIAYQSHAGGDLASSDWRDVDISASGLTTVVTHYPR